MADTAVGSEELPVRSLPRVARKRNKYKIQTRSALAVLPDHEGGTHDSDHRDRPPQGVPHGSSHRLRRTAAVRDQSASYVPADSEVAGLGGTSRRGSEERRGP